MVYKTSYSKDIPPPPKKNRDKSDIFLSVDIERILKIDEIGEVFKVKFKLYLTWMDARLSYRNMKQNANLNVLRGDAQKKLWTPETIFSNTEDSDRSKIDGESLIRALPNEENLYRTSDKSETQTVQYFQGAENFLQLSRSYKINFICSYDMALYPFDTQTCSMDFEQDEVILFACFHYLSNKFKKGRIFLLKSITTIVLYHNSFFFEAV